MNNNEKKAFDVPLEEINYRPKRERRKKLIKKHKNKVMKKMLIIDIEQSRKEVIQKWSKLGLLEGLEEIKSNAFDFTTPNENQKINEDPKQIVDD